METTLRRVATNPAANALTTHLFGNGALSPVDEWTVELPLSDNAFLRSVGAADGEQYGLAEIQDVALALEYETTPGSSLGPRMEHSSIRRNIRSPVS